MRKLLPHFAFALVVFGIAAFVVATARDSQPTETNTETTSDAFAAALPEPTTPPRTVERLLRLLQIGSYVPAIELLHPRVLKAFPSETLVNSLALRRPSLAGASFQTRAVGRTRMGTLVTAQVKATTGNALYSFVLQPVGREWRVLTDSFLGDALPEYVYGRERQLLGGNKATVDRRAAAAAARAAARYRALGLAPRSR